MAYSTVALPVTGSDEMPITLRNTVVTRVEIYTRIPEASGVTVPFS